MSSSERDNQSSEENSQRLARHRDEAQRMLRQLGAECNQHKDLSAARKQAIGSLVDTIDEQITLTQSASRETLASARRQLHEHAHKMHTELNSALDEVASAADHVVRSSMLAWTGALAKLDAELEKSEKSPSAK